MGKAIVLRIGGVITVLLLVASGLFFLIHLAPGDAASLLVPDDARPEQIAAMRAAWGLDKPLLFQFGRFITRLLTLDLGTSLRYQDGVADLILARLPATLELSLVSLLLATAVGVPLGIVAALGKGRMADIAASIVGVVGVSAPSFWVGILLVLLFSETLHLLPSGSRLPYDVELRAITGFYLIDSLLSGRIDIFWGVVSHLALPAITLSLGMLGVITRITRLSVLDVAQEDFVCTALAKGLSRGRIIGRHILPNAAIPIATVVGMELGSIISGSIIVEAVFSWPGMGTLLYQALTVRDTPLTTGVVLVYTGLFILLNVMIDLFYYAVDPRIRLGSGATGR